MSTTPFSVPNDILVKMECYKNVHLTDEQCLALGRFDVCDVVRKEDHNGAQLVEFTLLLDGEKVTRETCDLYGEAPSDDYDKAGLEKFNRFCEEHEDLMTNIMFASFRKKTPENRIDVIKDIAFDVREEFGLR